MIIAISAGVDRPKMPISSVPKQRARLTWPGRMLSCLHGVRLVHDLVQAEKLSIERRLRLDTFRIVCTNVDVFGPRVIDLEFLPPAQRSSSHDQ